ncbi:MAG: PAS domain S-box protein [Thermodesulfobacteriota bacterium]
MENKPTYEELLQRLKDLEQESSELKQAKEALQESEQKYRYLVENIPDVVYSIDTSLKVTAVNLPASEFYGFTVEEVIGRDFSEFIHPEDREKVIVSFLESAATHRQWTRGMQFRVRSKDGAVHWVELNSHMQFDENGGFKREEGVLRDIDDRKKAEQDLRLIHAELEERIEQRTRELVAVNRQLNQEISERIQIEQNLKSSEERLNIMFEYAPDAYYLNDPDGTIIAVNRAAVKLSGFEKEELLGKDIFQVGLLPEDQLPKAVDHFKRSVRNQPAGPVEYTLRRKDGETFFVEINTYPVEINGRNTFLGIARDITKKKQAESRLMKLHEELEKRVEQRTRDLARMNHELELKTLNLEEANTALKVLVKRRNEDQAEIEENILANVHELIMPLIDSLKGSQLDKRQTNWLDILEANLNDVISPFSRGLSNKYLKLTPTEFQVANFIKTGKSTKEISELLCVAPCTIHTYRDNIRKKLGIKNQKINLKTYLAAIS